MGASQGKDPIDRLVDMARILGALVILGGLCLGAVAGLSWWNSDWATVSWTFLIWAGVFVGLGVLLLVLDRLVRRYL